MNATTGTPQDDTQYGTSGNDFLDGAGGNDLLKATIDTSTDVLDGGAGNDTLEIVGDMYLYNQAYHATLSGGDGNDSIAIYEGGNALGTAAVVNLDGGTGNDVFTIDVGSGGANIVATGGGGTDRYVFGKDLLRSSVVITDFVAGDGGDVIDLSKVIAGALGTYRFSGGNPFAEGSLFRLKQAGADTVIEILDYTFWYSGQDPHSHFATLRNVDMKTLTAANFTGGLRPDGGTMPGVALTAPDAGGTLTGAYLDDTLTGGAGDDWLNGAYANDRLDGRGGDDLLRGGDGNDTLLGGAGNDTLYGGLGRNSLEGGAGDDVLAYGDRSPTGDGTGSTLLGGDGNDTFQAEDYRWSPGTSLMTGGNGSDTYVLSTRGAGEEGHLIITDFAAGPGGDVLVLDAIVNATRYDGGNPFDATFGYLSWQQQGSDLLLLYDLDGPESWHPDRVVLTLLDTRLEDLTADNLLYMGVPIPPLGGHVAGIAVDAAGIYAPSTVFDDTLRGNAEAQILEGGGGNDVIHGGDETGKEGASGDMIDGGSGSDTLFGEGGDDIIRGGKGNDSVDGGAGNDLLSAESGDDVLLGGTGNDTILAGYYGSGRVTVDGGAGIDVLQLGGNIEDYYYDKVTNDGFTIYSGAGSTQVTGIEIIDFVNARGLSWLLVRAKMASLGDDSLVGTDGNDTLDGLAGNDTMTGGRGDDVYLVDAAGDVIVEAANGGRDMVRTALGQVKLDPNVEELIYTGSGNFHGTGNAIANLIRGSSSGNNTLDGGAGADTLYGGGGRNEFVVDTAGDVIELYISDYSMVKVAFTASGTYTMMPYVHDGVIVAAPGLKVNLVGNWQRNVLTGDAGANVLDGGDGDDTLDGAAGADTLQGGVGNDTFIVNDKLDTIVEGEYTGTSDTALVSVDSYTLPTWVETGRFTGSGSVALTGNASSNLLAGGGGNDTLDGGAAGWDTLEGGDGDDLLVAGPVATMLDGGAGSDTLRGGTDGDLLIAGGGNDVVDGGDGTDWLSLEGGPERYTFARSGKDVLIRDSATGDMLTVRNVEVLQFSDKEGGVLVADLVAGPPGDGDDTVKGSDANDTIDGLQGRDRMIGGKGDDTYVVDNVGDVIVENPGEGRDTVQVALANGSYALAANVEDGKVTSIGAVGLTGNELANALTGNGAANKLDGGAGNDTLDGGKGSDVLIGGIGDDTYYVDAAGDKVTELADEGTDIVITALAKYTLGANVENLVYTGTAAFTATGNALDNVIAGADGNNTIDGGAGKDTFVVGGAFADYTRQRPNDTDVVLTKGTQKITLKNVEQVQFNDGLKTMGDIFHNIASQANDTLEGTEGNDSLDGLAGADRMEGGQGDDTYVVDNAADTIVEKAGAGRDTVQVALAKGSYTLAANVEDGIVTGKGAAGIAGNELANTLTGNAAANKLEGGAGNDTLDGGKGSDVLTGGSGNDTFYVDAAGDKVIELADEGADTVITVLAKYTLAANVENLVYAGTSAFTATGNALDNVITGGDGNNTIDGGAGTDTFVVSGAFADYTRQRPNATDVVLVKGTQKITLKNIEQVQFADGRKAMGDIFFNIASLADDTLVGTGGNDTMDGLAGTDQMSGGKGDDTYLVDNAGDTVIEKTGEGIDTVNVAIKAKATYTLADNVEHATITSTAAVNIVGNGADNRLTGNAAANALTGGDGNDTLIGGKGNDTLTGGAGNDVYSVDAAGDKVIEAENGGYDIVETLAAKYTLAANVEELRFTGKGAFTGIGNALDNVIIGGSGNDKLTGGAGADTFVIGTGNDTITDFASGIDRLAIDRAIGNGNGAIDGAVVLEAPGAFSSDAELVIFAQAVKSLKPADVAKVIGSASEAYADGDTALFALHDAKGTALFLFTSNGEDAAVSAGELKQIATLTGITSTGIDDYGLTALA